MAMQIRFRFVLSCLFVLTAICAAVPAGAAVVSPGAGYAMLFGDEFNTTPNPGAAWTNNGWAGVSAKSGASGIAASDHVSTRLVAGGAASERTLKRSLAITNQDDIIVSFTAEFEGPAAATATANSELVLEIGCVSLPTDTWVPVYSFDTYQTGTFAAQSISLQVGQIITGFGPTLGYMLRFRVSGPSPDFSGYWRIDDVSAWAKVTGMGGGPGGPGLAITTPSPLPTGTEGRRYMAPVEFAVAPATGWGFQWWSIDSGTLPDGYHLSVSGILTGDHNAIQGTYNFDVRVRSPFNGAMDTSSPFELTINPIGIVGPPGITTATIPDGEEGVAYQADFTSFGILTTATMEGFGLPVWLTFTDLGLGQAEVTGTPPAGSAGLHVFDVRLTTSDHTETKQFELSIMVATGPIPPAIITPSLNNATEGTVYGQLVQSVGGQGAKNWTSPNKPAWLTITPSGTFDCMLGGTPPSGSAGTVNFDLTVTDTLGSDTVNYDLTINAPGAAPLSVLTISLTNATVGTAYSQQLAATGGTPAYSWSVLSGALPTGLTLSGAGLITGTPAAGTHGTHTITFQVTDTAAGNATRTLNLTVAAGPVPPPPGGGTSGGGGGCSLSVESEAAWVWLVVLGLAGLLTLSMRGLRRRAYQ